LDFFSKSAPGKPPVVLPVLFLRYIGFLYDIYILTIRDLQDISYSDSARTSTTWTKCFLSPSSTLSMYVSNFNFYSKTTICNKHMLYAIII
jgi:adenine specific DNA methylase Mod